MAGGIVANDDTTMVLAIIMSVTKMPVDRDTLKIA